VRAIAAKGCAEGPPRPSGAELVAFDAEAVARTISTGLADAQRWEERSEAALSYVRRFDQEVLFSDLLRKLGVAAL
jgi:hypothetical protein